MKLRVKRIAYHRNGVTGEGFHAVEFSFREDGRTHRCIAVIFEGKGQCAVVSDGDVENRWRGDYFENDLRAALAEKAA